MSDTIGIGERQLRSRRRNWWLAFATYTGSTIFAALLAEKLLIPSSFGSTSTLSPNVVAVWVAIAVFGFVIGVYFYFQAMDEVEIRDNLVGAVAGLCTYVVTFPAWWLLWCGGVTPAPNAWVIYVGSLSVAGIVYLFRRAVTALSR